VGRTLLSASREIGSGSRGAALGMQPTACPEPAEGAQAMGT